MSVMSSPLPPNDWMFRLTQRKAAIWSYKPKFPGAAKSSVDRKPIQININWLVSDCCCVMLQLAEIGNVAITSGQFASSLRVT